MSISRTLKLGSTCLLAFVVAAQPGCSSKPKPPTMGKVSGKITRKGKPMPPVTVAFTAMSGGIPADYKYVTAKTDAEGKYAINELAEAEYMVSIVEDVQPMMEHQATAGTPQLAKFGPESPLRATVKAPEVEFSYDIPQ